MTTGRVVMLSAITTVVGAFLASKFNVNAPGFRR